jgi:transposase
MLNRKGYPTDCSDEEWAFATAYLCLMREDALQRQYPLREVFDALRYLARAGCAWRLLPNDLPPSGVVFQQAQRWIKAGCFEAMAHDLRAILRLAVGRQEQPTAVVLDARTLQSSVESGGRAGYDGHKKPKAAEPQPKGRMSSPNVGSGALVR